MRKLIGAFVVVVGLCVAEASAQTPSSSPRPETGKTLEGSGQTYPVKPVRVILGTAAGGTGDISARMVTQKMAESLGQPIVVETRPGAGGAIADEAVARAVPDGHTLLYAAGAITTLPALRTNLPYDVERDLAPISLVVLTVFTFAVHPSVPVHDVQGLIALARARPGQLTFSSPGIGSSAHLAGEAFSMMANVKMLHVPYKGAPEAIVGVVAGQIDVGVPAVTGALPLVNQGKLKVLAVSTLKRSALMPANFTSFAFCARSLRMKAANSSGVVVCTSRPCFTIASFISGALALLTMTVLSRVMISRDTPAGAKKPFHPARW